MISRSARFDRLLQAGNYTKMYHLVTQQDNPVHQEWRWEVFKEIARSPTASSDILLAILDNELDGPTQALVASHPNLPVDKICSLISSQGTYRKTRVAALCNPSCPVDVLVDTFNQTEDVKLRALLWDAFCRRDLITLLD